MEEYPAWACDDPNGAEHPIWGWRGHAPCRGRNYWAAARFDPKSDENFMRRKRWEWRMRETDWYVVGE